MRGRKTTKSENRNLYDLIRSRAGHWQKKQLGWRRHLHQYPETANEEVRTTAYLRQRVTELGLKIVPIKMKTGLLVELKGSSPGPVVGIRTDIDALPILEQTGLPFKSKLSGCMHACGHDMHMATVLGAAAILCDLKDRIAGTVRFIFQPAEEQPPGGARPMIANGALKNMRMLFGLHVDPRVPTGKIGLRDGVAMASVRDFDLIIKGTAGHAARPHAAVDAIVTAAEVIDSIQKVISRELDPISSAVITFGMIEGGVARNVIADRVHLVGTARTLSPEIYRRLPSMIKKVTAGVCKARGAKFTMEIIADYPVLANDPAANRIIKGAFESLFGKSKICLTEPVLGGEDFACYLQKVPGAMFRLGTRNKKIGADKPWHSPKFIVDDDALPIGSSLLAASVLDYLSLESR